VCQRVKRLFYNGVSKRKPTREARRTPGNRFISVATLFKQRYAERIMTRRNDLLVQDPSQTALAAYNQAVQIEFKEFKENNPGELEDLEQAVEGIQSAANLEFAQQSPDVQRV
jgi:hypothetical protein